MPVNLLYILYCYNRPLVLSNCLNTLFNNNSIRPDRLVIIDDGSEETMQDKLYLFRKDIVSQGLPCDYFSMRPNVGYATVAEIGMRVADAFDPKYVFFIESDYVFRKNGIDDVYEVLTNTELGKNAVGVAGYDHPDFYNRNKTHGLFSEIISNDFSHDPLNRSIYYKPQKTKLGDGREIEIEFTSNSCGTMYLNWHFIKMLREMFYPEMEKKWYEKVYDKHKQENRNLNDGIMSHGLSYFWQKWAEKKIDTSLYGPILNIKPSVANHLCAGGINGKLPGFYEGDTFVSSPSWKENV
ncbi:MAG: glycosyltransferase [Richelia sp. RM2_1_2]|nr:glycosyltransferase [Richelia sp. RM2_1_2]